MPSIVLASTQIGAVGGMETYVQNVALILKARGWTVHFIATNNQGNYFDVLSKQVCCHDLSPIPLSPRKVFSAARLINTLSPDIVLLNHCSLMHYSLPLVRPNIKPVAVLHSDDVRFYKTAALFAQRIFRWVAPSAGVGQRYENYLNKEAQGRIRTIPHGVSRAVFYPSGRRGPHAVRKITFIGHIAENKGADLLPAIFSRVITKCPETHLVIVGYGPMREYLESEFARTGLMNHVIFTGVLSPERVGDLLRETDVFLLPTRIEGFGLAIAEAMMCGAVPVSSRLSGITDRIIDDMETGFLVQQDSVEEFSGAIIRLLRDHNLLESMSHAANFTATDRFSQEKMIDAYESLFLEEDDREKTSQLGILGWGLESASEAIRKGIDRRWMLARAGELWR